MVLEGEDASVDASVFPDMIIFEFRRNKGLAPRGVWHFWHVGFFHHQRRFQKI